uniref:Lysine-specific metallo-endopeptidase domain-containing protein n=1 Tax=Percolomonas cosmopolitus TaxID=63605 RepID=A0A7S1KM16_9EUKA
MYTLFLLSVVFCTFASFSLSEKQPDIDITLWRLFEKYSQNGDKIRMRMDLFNNGAKYATLLQWKTPLDLHDETPLSEFLNVQFSHCSTEKPRGQMWCTIDASKANETVRYLGPRFKRANPLSSSYKKIRPGARVTENIDLSGMYDFSRVGFYTVEVKTQVQDLLRHWNNDYKIKNRVSANFTGLEPLVSNLMRFEIYEDDNERVDPTKPYEKPEKRKKVKFEKKDHIQCDGRSYPQSWELQGLTMHPKCTKEQKDTIQTTMKHIVHSLEKISTLSRGDMTNELKEWYDSADEQTFTLLQKDLKQLSNLLTSSNVTSQLDLQCGVEKKEDQGLCGTETYSFATARFNRINLCDKFFSAPPSKEEGGKPGRDTPEGLMMHELAHLVLDKKDWAISAKQCKTLNKEMRMENANNFQYFFEDLYRKEATKGQSKEKDEL